MALTKRVRGWLLRLVLNRTVAVPLGLSLLTPTVWLLIEELPWETSTTDGLGLIVGATGAALLIGGLGGRRPDWRDPE